MLNPKNEEAVYYLAKLKLSNSDYKKSKELNERLKLICNHFCNKSDKLKGGNMFFMDNNKIYEVKNKSNFMTVFPSYIPHAISPLHTDDDKDVSFLEQRFSIQFWVSLKIWNLKQLYLEEW